VPILINQETGLAEDLPQELADQALQSKSHELPFVDPQGNHVTASLDQAHDLLSQGYAQPNPDQLKDLTDYAKYSSPGEQAKTAIEGAASAASFGLSTAAERAFGVNPEDIQKRREVNPGMHTMGEMAGLAGSAMIPGLGAANVLRDAGEAVAGAAGLAEGTSLLAKVGSSAAKLATESAMMSAGSEASKLFSQDPNQSAESAIVDIGLSGLIGAGLGAPFGAVSPLWKMAGESKLGKFLQTIRDKANGVPQELVAPELDQALGRVGIDVPPEAKAILSNDPALQQMAKTLEQSDTSGAGLEYQKTLGDFKKRLGDTMVSALGKSPEEVAAAPEISKYEFGKKIGDTLAEEFDSQMSPLSKTFEELKGKYSSLDLPQDKESVIPADFSNPYNPISESVQSQPGLTSQIAEKIGQLAQEQGWAQSPSSDIMKLVNETLKELPIQKTLKNLGDFTTQIGNKANADILNGPLKRAGGMITGILREAEADVLGAQVGSEEGAEAIAKFQQARQAYAEQSKLKQAIDDRLHIGGSASGYAERLKQMAQTDGEALLRRLSGIGDVDALKTLQESFPKTFQAVQNFHIESLLDNAARKAKPGEAINPQALLKNLSKLDPAMREMIFPKEALSKIEAVGAVLDKFNELPHNVSNTARTWDKLSQYVPGSVIGMATMLTGHNPATALLLGGLTKVLGKDVPDAIKLGLLKFLGSAQPISSPAFKTMVEFATAAASGEQQMVKAVKSVFKPGVSALPQTQIAEKKRDKLKEQIDHFAKDPNGLMDVAGHTGYYLPDHASALSASAARATQYLQGLKPSEDKTGPLDAPKVPSQAQKAAYDRALDLAEQPLSILNYIKDGNLTSKDVQTVKTIYPALYDRLSQKLMDEMIGHVSDGSLVPYSTRMSLSLFMGQPLDSTLTPQGIQAAQVKAMPAQPGMQQGVGAPKHSMTSLGKMNQMYATPAQSRESDRIANKS
jgi:hypothetical protein